MSLFNKFYTNKFNSNSFFGLSGLVMYFDIWRSRLLIMLCEKKTVRVSCVQQDVYKHAYIQLIYIYKYIYTYIHIYIFIWCNISSCGLFVALECYNIMPILVQHKHVSRLVTVYISNPCSNESSVLSSLQDYRFRRSIYC